MKLAAFVISITFITAIFKPFTNGKIFRNGNIEIQSPGKGDLGSEHTFSCLLPSGQQVLSCEILTPRREVWRVEEDNLVVDSDGTTVEGYFGIIGNSSARLCGINIVKVATNDFGDWQCRIQRQNGSTKMIQGHANIRKESLVSKVRLKIDVVPVHYDLRIIPLIQPEKTIRGEFNISLQVFGINGPDNTRNGKAAFGKCSLNCTSNSTISEFREIVLHSLNMTIDEESIRIINNETAEELLVVYHGYDFERQFYIIGFILPENTTTNSLQISGRYSASLLGGPVGFYNDSYKDTNGTLHELAATHLEPTYARRVFPCFDEPNMKATFSISLAHTSDQRALSNMPVKRVNISVNGYAGYLWTEFQTSVKMSTYLVALAVSDLAPLECDTLSNGVKTTIWARPEDIQKGFADWPRSFAAEILQYFEQLFQQPYPIPKLDLFVLPSPGKGGMENWGLVVFDEPTFLYNPVFDGPLEKARSVLVTAHELAHQWFGNLVTMKWWNGLWLNEGLTTLASYYGSQHVSPEMEYLDRFTISEMHPALRLDSTLNSHPVDNDVNNPEQIGKSFDTICYSKGASLMRMVKSFLTEETFIKGIRKYLSHLKFDNAEQDDLWRHLDGAGHEDGTLDVDKDVKTIMETWTEQKNYPLLTVTRIDESNVQLQQSRFVSSSSIKKDDYKWWIPITFTVASDSQTDFNTTNTKLFMTPNATSNVLQIASTYPIIFNIQQTGFYRVNYDQDNWNKIANLLQENHAIVHQLNRAQILDDSFVLAEAGKIPYSTALDMTKYLHLEKDYVPFYAANYHFKRLEIRLRFTPGYNVYKSYLQSILSNRMRYLEMDQTENFTFMENLMREELLPLACLVGTSACTSSAAQTMRSDSSQNSFAIKMKKQFYCAAVRNDLGRNSWDFIFNQIYAGSNSLSKGEREALMYSLTCTENEYILSDLLTRLLNGSAPMHKDIVKLSGFVSGNVVGRTLIWPWLVNNWSLINSTGLRDGAVAKIANVFSTFATEQQDAEMLEKFYADFGKTMSNEIKKAVKDAIEKTNENVEWYEQHYSSIVTWLKNNINNF